MLSAGDIMKKALVVGAGLTGITAARILAENQYQVHVLEKRGNIGGNCYDYLENNIWIQKYGPHIFHTNKKSVVEFLENFGAFDAYNHEVLGLVDGTLVPIPFNLDSMKILFDKEKI
jgi:UDP-galactopyranose mutase